MPHVTKVRLHEAEEVKGFVDEALRIVTELEVMGDLVVPAFVETVRMLSASVPIVQEETAVSPGLIGLPPLPNGGRF